MHVGQSDRDYERRVRSTDNPGCAALVMIAAATLTVVLAYTVGTAAGIAAGLAALCVAGMVLS